MYVGAKKFFGQNSYKILIYIIFAAVPQLAKAVYGADSEENQKKIIDAITSNSPKVWTEKKTE